MSLNRGASVAGAESALRSADPPNLLRVIPAKGAKWHHNGHRHA
jgi:hypothetical protein